jgi:endonuclease/exonuclease/phosphatase family metal-dependent hydrolase
LNRIACLALILLLACLGCSSKGQAAQRAQTPSPGTPLTLHLMAFNVLFGAGVERRFDEHVPARFQGRDRFPEVLDFVKKMQPDILSIEEAAGWDEGSPSPAEQVAQALGMNYVIAPDQWELHIVLYSRFPILDSEYTSRFEGFNGVLLRATVAVAPGQILQVFAVHFNSMSPITRSCQVNDLLDLARHHPGPAILLGDMNFRPTASQAEALLAAGWKLVYSQPRSAIDQIWAGPGLGFTVGDWWESRPPLGEVSDHLPVGAGITVSLPASSTASMVDSSSSSPAILDYACDLP